MTMTIKITKEEMQEIIAKYFHVSKEQVNVMCFTDTRGYGMAEESFPNCKAEIDIKDSQKTS